MAAKKPLCWLTAAWILVGLARPAAAEGRADWGATLAAAALGSNAGGGLALDGRLLAPSGIQLGGVVAGQGLSFGFVSGRKLEGLAAGDASLLALFPLLTSQPVELDVRCSSGVRYLRDVGERLGPEREALRSSTELGLLAHVRFAPRWLLRAGGIINFDLEVQPTVELADQAQFLSVGLGHALGSNLLLFGNVDAGGTYGFDGDNGKAVVRGALGLRLAFAADSLAAF